MSATYGASPADWTHFADTLSLVADLLPVVSNPNATISPGSKLKDLGKTPSRYNRDNEVVGIADWTRKVSTDRDVARWMREADHGICVQTRTVRAIDVDIGDPVEAARVAEFIEVGLGIDLPRRQRPDSGKFLLVLHMPGEFAKRVIRTAHGAIEFLATGQQFIAVGTHPKGQRYEWAGGLPAQVPEVTPAEFEALWAALGAAFALPGGSSMERRGVAPSIPRSKLDMHDDPVVAFLSENGWVREFDRDGRVHIRCPWEDEHTTDSGPSATTYFPAGVGGFARGGWRCLHAHCAGRDAGEFERAVGWTEAQFEVVAALGEGGAPAVDGEREWPPLERDKQGRIECTVSNLLAMLARPDICGARMAYDQFKDACLIGYSADAKWRPLRDTDYTQLRMLLEQRGVKRPGREMVRDCALKVCEQNTIDTAVQWVEGLQWDGVERVDTFFADFFSVRLTPYTRAVARYMWTAMAGRAAVPGVKADMVPVLISSQGRGKTSMIEALAPDEDAFLEVNLEVRDDNLARSLRGKLVGEWAELRGLLTRDKEAIKAWVTRRHEEWIPKFMEFATRYARRMVLIGTGNSNEILDDDTGERRWLPLHVGEVDVPGIRAVVAQLWAEGLVLYRRHGVLWQDAQRLAVDEHALFKVTDSWDDAIANWVESDAMDEKDGPKRGDMPFSLAAVAAGAIGLDLRKITIKEERRIGKVLRRLGFEKRQMRTGDGRGWRWVRATNNPSSVLDIA